MQVGSFASNREADELKARLAIIGIETEIVKVALPDGTFGKSQNWTDFR